MIMNSVNYKTGKKFHQTKEDLMRVKEFSNKLCLEYGLSQTEVKSDWKEMPKRKVKLRNEAYYAAKVSRTKEGFIRFMESRGYVTDDKTLPEQKNADHNEQNIA